MSRLVAGSYPAGTPMPSNMEAALQYLERGWSVFPLHDKRRPCVDWKKYQAERPTREQLVEWWTQWPDAMIAVALGSVSGIIRVDADGEGYAELDRLGGPSATLEFTSPSGGKGWLYKYVEGFTTHVVWTGQNQHSELRIQSTGAYTVIPPSQGYEWTTDVQPANPPRWMLDFYSAIVMRQLERERSPTLKQPDMAEVQLAMCFIPADSYDRWVQVGMALKSSGDSAENLDLWDRWSSTCAEKYKPGECQRKWQTFIDGGGLTLRSIMHWAIECGYRPVNRHEPLTELGNARVLARMFEGQLLHSGRWGWLFWDGKRWELEGGEKACVERQKEVLAFRLDRAIESLQKLLKREASVEERDFAVQKKSKLATIQLIRKHEDERSIRGARKLAESEPSLSVDYQQFNKDPWLLNCVNGMLDLTNGELHEHDASRMCTQLCPTAYDPDARCDRWQQFLVEVFNNDSQLISWMQKLCGYAMSGVIREHILPIFHGVGRNGKSTLIKAIQHVLGPDYSGTTPSGFLTASKHEQHPTKLVALYGKRFVADLETGDGARLNEELVKRCTGGDEMQARRMFENFWSFKPTHKLILCTNCEPRVRGMDVAIWSRVKLVPFSQVFAGREDPMLDAKLASEASGILNWMLEGSYKWQAEGLGTVAAVSAATDDYRGSQDTVASFMADRLEAVPGAKVKLTEVQAAYKGWCMGQSADPVASKVLKERLFELGVKPDASGRYYEGYKL